MKLRVQIIFAVCIALAGAILAVRSVYRQPGASLSERLGTVEDSAEMVEAREYVRSFDDDFVVLQREEVPRVIVELGKSAESKLERLSTRISFSERQRKDLGTAYIARLRQLFGGTYDDNLRDLASRGWELPDEDFISTRRPQWDRSNRNAPLPPIALTELIVRVVDPDALQQHGGLKKEGYGLTELSYDAPGAAGAFDSRGQTIVEVTVPMRIKDISGTELTALISYVFAWDDRLERWRTLRVLRHYAEPDIDGISILPLI